MTDDIKLFLGAAVLTVMFAVLGAWIGEPYSTAAVAQFSALIGAATMKMKGNT
jgi:hypothetical protein